MGKIGGIMGSGLLTSKPWIPSKFEEVAEEIYQDSLLCKNKL